MQDEVTITKLSDEVKSKLRSGLSITSISQCVEELVLNAIDGEATCIAVRVDLNIYRIQVVDNGMGISENDLKQIGARYTTSKCHTLEDLTRNLSYYGFRGEALASIIQLGGVVEIISRHRNSAHTYSKLFTYGKEKGVIMCDTNRPSVGTTVTIQDFMHNMPVRRKFAKVSIDLENIRIQLECIALINPIISISLRNDGNNKTILQTKKSKSSLDTFIQLFGNEHSASITETYYSHSKYTVFGFMSTQPHYNKALQFIYVNKRFIIQTKIHSFINELFNCTSIIRNKTSSIAPPPHADKTLHSPTKGIRYYGVFFLNIECTFSEYDICMDPKKTLVQFKDWHNLLVCIEEMMLKFVKEEGLSISLDDRFRKSEKETLETYSESPMPSSSLSLLQVFSKSKENTCKDKVDRTSSEIATENEISIKNIKAVIQSFPANRRKLEQVRKDRINVEEPCILNERQLDKIEDTNFIKRTNPTTNKNCKELSEKTNSDSYNVNNLDVYSGLLNENTPLNKHILPSTLNAMTNKKNIVAVLEVENGTNWHKKEHTSSIDTLKSLFALKQNSDHQFSINNTKVTKDDCNHLSSVQELKNIYQQKLRENASTPVNYLKPVILSPQPDEIRLSKFNDTHESLDLYYSRQAKDTKKKNSKNGLSGSLSQKLTKKKKEKFIKKTLNSFKFKKYSHVKNNVFKSKDSSGQIDFLNCPVDKTACYPNFNFDPVSESNKKNYENNVPMTSKANSYEFNTDAYPDYYLNCNNTLQEPILGKTDIDKMGEIRRKNNIYSQLCLEDSCTLNIRENKNKVKETQHHPENGLNIPAKLFGEPVNSVDFHHDNSTILAPSFNVQNSGNSDIKYNSQNDKKKIFNQTSSYDIDLLYESSQLNEIVSNVNNFSNNSEVKDNYFSNSNCIDNIVCQEMESDLDGVESNLFYDAAKKGSPSDGDLVIPFENTFLTNYLEHHTQNSTSAMLIKPYDNSNLHSNVIYEDANKASNTSHKHLLPIEDSQNLDIYNINNCSNSCYLKERQHSEDLNINLSIEAIALDKRSNKIPDANYVNRLMYTTLNNATQKCIHPLEIGTKYYSKEIYTDVNALQLSRSFISQTPFKNTNQSLSQMASLDKNYGGECLSMETSKNTTNVNDSVSPVVEHPTFMSSVTTANIINDQISEPKNFENSETVLNDNKRDEYLSLSKFCEIPLKDCGILEIKASSYKNVTKDFVANHEYSSFLPVKRKNDNNNIGFIKLPKVDSTLQTVSEVSTMVPSENHSSDHHNLINVDNCLKPNETNLTKLLTSDGQGCLVITGQKEELDQCLEANDSKFKGISQNEKHFTLSNSPNSLFLISEKQVSKDQLPNDLEVISEMPCSFQSTEKEISEEILQKHNLAFSSSVDSNEVFELLSSETDNSPCVGNSISVPYLKDDLTTFGNGLLPQVTQNLNLTVPQCPLSVTQETYPISLNSGATEMSVASESDTLIVAKSNSELLPVNCVDEFDLPYMEKALDSVSNEHSDLLYLSNGGSKNDSLIMESFDIGTLLDEMSVPKIAMNTEILSSNCEERERFSNIKSYNVVHPYKFESNMLQVCKVLGQVDNKFIAIAFTCGSTLVKNSVPSQSYNLIALVDQHAADERVQLENVLAISYNENNKQLKRKHLTNPLEINFRPEEVRIMKAYREAFLDIGLELTFVNNEIVLFHTLPCCLVAQERSEKNTRRCQTADRVIESTVREMCETIRLMGGTSKNLESRPLPKPLQHIFNTIACKNAIKFGDGLSMEKCINLIELLSKCKLPFQCAHGRPSIIPVVDLNYLDSKPKEFKLKPRPNLKKLTSYKLS